MGVINIRDQGGKIRMRVYEGGHRKNKHMGQWEHEILKG